MSDVGTSSGIESGQSILADHAPGAGLPPPPARRPFRRGELKTDLAIQRHELMRENLALKNELAARRNEYDATVYKQTTRIIDLEGERDVLKARVAWAESAAARCRWCPVRWWISRRHKKDDNA